MSYIDYEWSVETIADDLVVLNAEYYVRPSQVLDALRDWPALEPGQRLDVVLVRDTWTEEDGTTDRSWAYVEGGRLPEVFANSNTGHDHRVPARRRRMFDAVADQIVAELARINRSCVTQK